MPSAKSAVRSSTVWPVRSRSRAGSSWVERGGVDGPLGGGERQRGAVGQAPYDARDLGLELLVRHDRRRSARRRTPRGRSAARRAAPSASPGPARSRRRRSRSSRRPASARSGRRRAGSDADSLGDDQVGGERGRAADAGGDAVDRGDDRLVEPGDRADDPVGAIQRGDVEALVGVLARDVGAGAERRAGAGQRRRPAPRRRRPPARRVSAERVGQRRRRGRCRPRAG